VVLARAAPRCAEHVDGQLTSPEPHRVTFIQGADALAPGLSRTQDALITALSSEHGFTIRRLRFPSYSYRLLLPYMYGPLPATTILSRPALVHLGSSWYSHLIPLLPVPAIVTCHDLIELDTLRRDPASLEPHRRFHARAMRRGLRHAHFIACVSEATARRVASHLPETSNRIRVIYNGVSPAFSPDPAAIAPRLAGVARPPYVLYVGSEQERKNLDRLAAAIAIAARDEPRLRFVKVGMHQTIEGRARFEAALRREGLEERTTIIGGVTDEELAVLYRYASATVLVSLEEGFGFPALEAMACGCPAIVSNRGALQEITGESALQVDPYDVRAIAAAIASTLSNTGLQRRLSIEGPARAAHFTWSRAARQYAALYVEALSWRQAVGT